MLQYSTKSDNPGWYEGQLEDLQTAINELDRYNLPQVCFDIFCHQENYHSVTPLLLDITGVTRGLDEVNGEDVDDFVAEYSECAKDYLNDIVEAYEYVPASLKPLEPAGDLDLPF